MRGSATAFDGTLGKEAKVRGLVTLAIVLLVIWVVGTLFFKVVGAAIHLLLLVGLVLLVLAVVRRGAGAMRRRV